MSRSLAYRRLDKDLTRVSGQYSDMTMLVVDEGGDLIKTVLSLKGVYADVLYRQYKEGVGKAEKRRFEGAIYKNKITHKDIEKYTIPIGDKVLDFLEE